MGKGKAGGIAFSVTFFASAAAIIIQLIITGELPIVLGETVALLVGGVAYIGIMLHYGIWETGSAFKSTPLIDAMISVLCAGIFTIALIACYLRLGASSTQASHIAALFFAGTAAVGFAVLRLLAYCNQKRRLNANNPGSSVQ